MKFDLRKWLDGRPTAPPVAPPAGLPEHGAGSRRPPGDCVNGEDPGFQLSVQALGYDPAKMAASMNSGTVDLYTGEGPRTITELSSKWESPHDIRQQLEMAERWYQRTHLVRFVCNKKTQFCTYGLRVHLEGADDPAVTAWLDGYQSDADKAKHRRRREVIRHFVAQAARDLFVYSNVVALVDAQKRMSLLQPEKCGYSDQYGVENLKWTPGWTSQNAPTPQLRERIARGGGQLVVGEDGSGEWFRVLKQSKDGLGFDTPEIYTAFRVLSQFESMEVGEAQLALGCRTPIRQHKLGSEIKSSLMGARPERLATKEWIAAVASQFKGKMGFFEFADRHDHEVVYVTVPPDLFSADAYDSPIRRLMYWAGPVLMLQMNKDASMVPVILRLLGMEMAETREHFTPYAEAVLSETFGREVRIGWRSNCFEDARTASEMMRFGVSTGAVSLETFIEDRGMDIERERARKQQEAKEAETWLPLYDAAHGPIDEGGRTNGGGRPAGKADPAV